MRSTLVAIATACGTIAACQSPCELGFQRHADGVCRAQQACVDGTARGTDLRCHPWDNGSVPSAVGSDTGSDAASEYNGPEAGAQRHDTGDHAATAHIRVVMHQLEGFPLHGMVVLATEPTGNVPIASFCQVILDDPMNIEGFLVPYDGHSDPCPNAGAPFQFDSDELILQMAISLGATADPELCDTRVVSMGDDTTVDYTGVMGCTP